MGLQLYFNGGVILPEGEQQVATEVPQGGNHDGNEFEDIEVLDKDDEPEAVA